MICHKEEFFFIIVLFQCLTCAYICCLGLLPMQLSAAKMSVTCQGHCQMSNVKVITHPHAYTNTSQSLTDLLQLIQFLHIQLQQKPQNSPRVWTSWPLVIFETWREGHLSSGSRPHSWWRRRTRWCPPGSGQTLWSCTSCPWWDLRLWRLAGGSSLALWTTPA